MGLLSNKIRREQLNPGDHIYTWRNGYSYSHHGIYVGDGKVIHLTRAPGPLILSSSNDEWSPSHPSGSDRVVCCSIEEFLSDGDLYLYGYGVKTAIFVIKRGGTCTRTSSDPPTDVLHRASILLEKGFGDYHLFQNNCEDFAIYCKTGMLTVDMIRHGRSGQINFVYAIFIAMDVAPYQFLPSGLTSTALVVYGLYCFLILIPDRDVEKVAVEKFDSSYRRTLRIETDSTRSSSSSTSAKYYLFYIYQVLNYWPWTSTSRILLWIRLVNLCCCFHAFISDHLRNHPMNVKLWEYVACIIWALGYWYWSSESRIYFWTKLCTLYSVLLLFVSDHPRRLKVQECISHTTFVLGLWYWTPENTILVWIKLFLLNLVLSRFIPDHLRNPRSIKFCRFFAACVAIQSAAFFWGLDYRDYFFRNITKSIFL